MYPTNTTEYFAMQYPVFDNTTALYMHGFINETTPIYLNSTGYLSAVAEVRGMDLLILLAVVIMVLQIAITTMLIWEHIRTTWGGRKNL